MASAHEVSRAVRAWHAASSPEEKAALQVRIRQPVLLPHPPLSSQDSQRDVSMQVVPDSQEGLAAKEASELASAASAPSNSDTTASSQTAAPAPQAPADAMPPSTTGLPSSTPAPAGVPSRSQSHQRQLVHPRAPVFGLPLTSTTYTLSDSDLPSSYRDVSTANIVNELFQDLMCYAPPPEPTDAQSSVLHRRIDEASPSYSQITNASALLESKPLLVSTLHPAKKRKRGDGEWDNLRDVAGESGRDVLSDMFGPQAGKLRRNACLAACDSSGTVTDGGLWRIMSGRVRRYPAQGYEQQAVPPKPASERRSARCSTGLVSRRRSAAADNCSPVQLQLGSCCVGLQQLSSAAARRRAPSVGLLRPMAQAVRTSYAESSRSHAAAEWCCRTSCCCTRWRSDTSIAIYKQEGSTGLEHRICGSWARSWRLCQPGRTCYSSSRFARSTRYRQKAGDVKSLHPAPVDRGSDKEGAEAARDPAEAE